MFRFTEPSSGQISKHSTGTFSIQWTKIQRVQWTEFQRVQWTEIQRVSESKFSEFSEPKFSELSEPKFSECVEPKHVAEFLILVTNICCFIDWTNYCIIAKDNGVAPIRVSRLVPENWNETVRLVSWIPSILLLLHWLLSAHSRSVLWIWLLLCFVEWDMSSFV
jgi:hypothetical protein